ncbi:MAG TPA: TIGR00730 family Rossman fold protein [Rectinemataceae bacterium]|nr:TIGR00730 family Rossman fold protein [Rectinemataceae bacterium]
MFGSVCVFCGSSDGLRPAYLEAARAMGRELARRGIRLVYGGGDIGCMGALSRAALAAGGEVLGIIPKRLFERVATAELSELIVASDMHDRKARMYGAADAFVALPGGVGTMDELFEAWTWRQLGYHQKPVGILEVEGYFAPFLSLIERISAEGFMNAGLVADLVVDTEPSMLLDRRELAPPIAHHTLPEARG